MNRFPSRASRRAEKNMAVNKTASSKTSILLFTLAIVFIGITILLIWMPGNWTSPVAEKTQLLINGFAGLFAILSVICTTIFMYRLHSSYWKFRV